jgi:heme/copper-type cytochrome/quinol oxidase subunit 1
MGLVVAGLSTILGAVSMITMVICLWAPGMTMWRLPIFSWNILFTSILVLLAFPILTAALLGLEADRRLGAHVFRPSQRGRDPVAAPVLVFRPPRGPYRCTAIFWYRDRDLPGF